MTEDQAPLSETPISRDASGDHQPSALTDVELQAIADRQIDRNRLFVMSAIIQVVATVSFVILAIILLLSAGQQRAFAERSDCKTTYNSILQKPIIDRDNLKSDVGVLTGDLESQLGSALLGIEQGVKVSQAVINSYSATKDQLDAKRNELEASIAKVNALPSLATASNNGFTFNGVKYPACPIAS